MTEQKLPDLVTPGDCHECRATVWDESGSPACPPTCPTVLDERRVATKLGATCKVCPGGTLAECDRCLGRAEGGLNPDIGEKEMAAIRQREAEASDWIARRG